MTVQKSKRGTGKLAVITLSRRLSRYTMRICTNEKNFPKRFRWCITQKIVNFALDISNLLVMANSVFIQTKADLELRRSYQKQALSTSYALLSMIDLANLSFHIKGRRIEYWTYLVTGIQKLLRGWIDSDAKKVIE